MLQLAAYVHADEANGPAGLDSLQIDMKGGDVLFIPLLRVCWPTKRII